MRATHKNQGATVQVQSAIPRARLEQICVEVAATVRSSPTMNQLGVYAIEYLGGDGVALHFAVRRAAWGRLRGTLMTFRVMMAGNSSGSAATSQIDDFIVTQDRLMFIPVLPKQLQGYPAYRLFMEQFSDAVVREDPAARVAITEQVPSQ